MAETNWTDDLKQQVISMYLDYEPTPENSMELVKRVVEDLEGEGISKTVNGVRMILNKAEVYIKKATTTKKDDDGEKKPKKPSKADAVVELKAAIEKTGVEVDDGIISKMTGIAAGYFTKVINATQG